MNAAHQLGVALRRLGSLGAIRQVRTETAERFDRNGDAAALNERLQDRASRAYAEMLQVEKDVLG